VIAAGFRLGAVSQMSALPSLCGKTPLLPMVPAFSEADVVFVGAREDSTISEQMDMEVLRWREAKPRSMPM
jgi:hypothetical protein